MALCRPYAEQHLQCNVWRRKNERWWNRNNSEEKYTRRALLSFCRTRATTPFNRIGIARIASGSQTFLCLFEMFHILISSNGSNVAWRSVSIVVDATRDEEYFLSKTLVIGTHASTATQNTLKAMCTYKNKSKDIGNGIIIWRFCPKRIN